MTPSLARRYHLARGARALGRLGPQTFQAREGKPGVLRQRLLRPSQNLRRPCSLYRTGGPRALPTWQAVRGRAWPPKSGRRSKRRAGGEGSRLGPRVRRARSPAEKTFPSAACVATHSRPAACSCAAAAADGRRRQEPARIAERLAGPPGRFFNGWCKAAVIERQVPGAKPRTVWRPGTRQHVGSVAESGSAPGGVSAG